MNRIKLLPNEIINKIAAGEVVERPMSVVKELVENSIDSGATVIKIDVFDGGLKQILVHDNGSGIPEDDIELLFERHATSKIKTESDIYDIKTLGFRGEALSSICSVSSIELQTKTEDSKGTCVLVTGGKIISKKNCPSNKGTIIKINDLFYNAPARKKFLKSRQTEVSEITRMIQTIAVANPNIRFVYTVDNKTIFTTNGDSNMKNAITATYGIETSKGLIPIDIDINDSIRIFGYISNLTFYKSSRQSSITFVNNRVVKLDSLRDYIENEYRTLIPIGKFPAYFINLVIDFSRVDVNVHPNKMKIKIENENDLFNDSYGKIRNILYSISEVKKFKIENKMFYENNPQKINNSKYIYEETLEDKPNIDNFDYSFESINIDEYIIDKEISNDKDEIIFLESSYDNLIYIGQIFQSYLLFQKNNSLVIIDQHAAHEKYNYEKFMNSFTEEQKYIQSLLLPYSIEIPSAIMYNFEIGKILLKLIKLGFDITQFSERTLILRGIPSVFQLKEAIEFINSYLEQISEKSIELIEHFEEEIISHSCKKAIKANDKLESIEAIDLINKLKHLNDPYTCPHGRPILVALDKKEFDKYFNRT
jgi:DNA mismatch repair protein MutL